MPDTVDSVRLRRRPFSLFAGICMTHPTDAAKGREIVARWCALAEARLEHLTELFDSGRWRRYYTDLVFLENIREARTAVRIWRDLLQREASPGISPADSSRLGGVQAAMPPVSLVREPPQTAELPVEPQRRMTQAAASIEEALMKALVPAGAPRSDVTAMQERYPLLRNAL